MPVDAALEQEAIMGRMALAGWAGLAFGLTTVTAVARPPALAAAVGDSVRVEVQNNRRVPVTVYLEYGQFDRRLGTVPAMSTAVLAMPDWVVRQDRVQLFVHPEGELELATQEFRVHPGATIGLLVPASGNMPRSTEATDTMSAALLPEELAETTLTVDNPRSVDVIVYASLPPFDIRLGRVPARSRATLQFPKAAIRADQSVVILVHPVRGQDLESQTLRVRWGEHLGLRVPAGD